MKSKQLIIQVSFLLLVAIASSTLTYFYVNATTIQEKPPGSMVDRMNKVYSELDLEDDQIEKFNQITGEFHGKGKVISKQLKQINLSFYEEIASAETDSAVIEELSKQYGNYQHEAKLLMANYYFQAEQFLDHKQIKKLKGIYGYLVEKRK